MTDKLFDQFIKSRLEQHDSGAPMHVWERIKDDKDRKPKGFFVWWNRYLLLLGGLLLTAVITYMLLNTDKTSKGITDVKSTTESAEQQDASAGTHTLTQPQTNGTDKKLPSTENQIQKTNTETNTDRSNQITTTETTQSSSTNVAATQRSQQRKTSTSVQILPGSFSSAKNRNTSSLNTQSNSASADDAAATSMQDQVLAMSGFSRNTDSKPKLKLGNISMPQNKPTCPTINGPRRRDFYLEAYVSPDYNVRSLETSNTPGNYVADRNAIENYRTSFSGGVRLVKNLGEKTLLKTGINYTQINERLRLVAENSKQLTQIITIRTVVRSPGDTLFVRDTMYYEQTGTRYRTTYNRFRFIDVPVIFSYEFGNPDLLHFSINAGPVFNIISFYNGEVLDTSYRPLAISTKAGTNVNNWRNNIGMGMFASVSIFKKLNDRIHLFGEPYIRYNLNPVTQQNNLIKQRYLVTGMQLGIRYNFIPPGQRYKR